MDKTILLNGLIFSCPMQVSNLDCPFKKIRDLFLPDRFDFVKNLQFSEINNLIEHHKICLHRREKSHLQTK